MNIKIKCLSHLKPATEDYVKAHYGLDGYGCGLCQAQVPCESTTTRIAGGLDFTAIGGKIQGRVVPHSLRVKPGAKHPV